MPLTVLVLARDDPQLPSLAAMFEAYRQHYGQPASSGTADWVAGAARTGSLTFFLAVQDGATVGFASSHELPASLLLGRFWMLRDVYVDPTGRRLGVGSALVDAVVEAARAAGAVRLSVQTETDNAGALSLYRRLGFAPVAGLDQLSLALVR